MKKWLSLSVLALLLTLLIYYIVTNLNQFKTLRLVNPAYFLIILILVLISYYLTGVVTLFLVRPFGINLSYNEAFGMSIVTGFYNLITPFRGGIITRAVYLKKKYKLPYTKFLATLSGTAIIIFLVASFMGVIGISFFLLDNSIENFIVFLIFIWTFIFCLGLILVSPRISKGKNKILNKLYDVINGWNLISRQRKNVGIISMIVLLQFVLGCILIIVSFGLFGIHLSIPAALVIVSLGTLGILIQITPAGLGIAEAVNVLSGLLIGIPPSQTISVSIISRLITSLALLILGPIYSYFLLKKK